MNSRFVITFFFVASMVLTFTGQSLAAENLTDWSNNVWQGNISLVAAGTEASINADGSGGEAWEGLEKYFPDAIGAVAQFTVSSMLGNCHVGLRKYVGTTSNGTNILAELRVSQWNGEKRIDYRVRERDDQHNTIKVIARGWLGNYYGGWTLGETVTVGLALIDGNIWFYTPNNGAFTQIVLFEAMDPIDATISLEGWTESGASNSVSAVAGNVEILYPDNLGVFETEPASRSSIEEFVTRFYQLCLGREPEAAGLAWWTDDLVAQVQTGADVARGFINSQEFIDQNTTDEEYLTILYQAFFNREPDQGGMNGWLADLNSGQSRGYVLGGFIDSSEFADLAQSYGITAK